MIRGAKMEVREWDDKKKGVGREDRSGNMQLFRNIKMFIENGKGERERGEPKFLVR